MFTALESALTGLIHTIPLETFVFFASFVEEVIAPIPSPTVMVLSGSFAAMQGYGLSALLMLAVIGAIGKTIGALIVYTIAHKMESLLIPRFGQYFGVTTSDSETFRAKLGNGYKDYLLLTFFRALPIMPSSLISVGCGLIGVPLPAYVASTFLGTIVRDSVYLYAGFVGTDIFARLITHTSAVESYVQLAVLAGVAIGLMYLFARQRRNKKSEKNTPIT